MASFSCPNCGAPVFPPPGSCSAVCPHCRVPAVAVLKPVPAAQARQSTGWVLWVFLAVGVLVVLTVGLRSLVGGGAKVVMASGPARPVSALAGPIRARPVIRSSGRRVLIGLSLTDSKGGRVRGVYLAGGRRPAAPRVSIFNTAGTEVYRCKLAYG